MATTWAQTSDTAITAELAAVGAGQTLVDGWIDLVGDVWSAKTLWAADTGTTDICLTSVAENTPWYGGPLYRPVEEVCVNQRVVSRVRIDTNQTIWHILRGNRATTSTGFNGYLVAINSTKTLQIFAATNGAVTTSQVVSQRISGLVNGHFYTLDMSITQVTDTTSQLVVSVTDSTGATISTYDTGTTNSLINTAALQNTPGSVGLAAYSATSTNTAGVQEITVYNGDAAATSATKYTLTGPTSVQVGTAATYTLQPDAAPTADVVVTLVSSLAGAFSSKTVTLPAGSSASQTVTFTASAAGSGAISSTNNGSLTDPASLTVTAQTAVVSPTKYTISPASSSVVSGATTTVTFTLDAAATSAVTITPLDGSAGGKWSAATVAIAAGDTSGSLTYTAGSAVGTVALTGSNTAGLTNGTASLTVTAAAAAPSAPTFTLASGNGQIVVKVTAPSSNGGAAITGYPIYVGSTAGAEASSPVTTLSAAGSYTLTGLTNGTPIYVKVGATNSVGTTTAAEQTATPVAPAPTGTLVTVDSPAFVFSPGNWKGDSGRGGSSWRRTWNVGSYLRFGMKAGASPSAVLHLGPSTTGGQVLTFTNGGSMTWSKASGDVTIPGLVANASNVISMRLDLTPQSARWNSGANNLVVSGVTIDAGSVISALSVLSRGWVMIVGDSITEGILANNSKDDFSYSYTSHLMDALAVAGYELCVSACGYSGYLVTGDSTKDVPAYYQVTGSSNGQGGAFNASGSRFGLIDVDTSLLDSAGHISGWGDVGQEPAAIIVNYGTNEALGTNGGPWSVSDFTAAMVQSMAAHRAKAPNAWLMPMMPVGFYYAGEYDPKWRTAFNQAVALYKSAYPSDLKVAVIDIGLDLSDRIQANSTYMNSGDVHPNVLGHAVIGSAVSAQVVKVLTGSSTAARSPNYGPASGG